MFKIFIGFILGCFVTYNYILPNDQYRQLLDDANEYALHLIQSIEKELQKNVENR